EWDDDEAERTRNLLRRIGPTLRVDLLLDLGTVADRPDAAKEALRALDALFPLAPWRTVAVLAGGYPDNGTLNGMWHRGRAEPDRADRETWRQLTRADRPWLRHVHYGDYGPFAAESIAAEHRGGGGPPWGMLRYTTDRTWLVAKAPTRGPDRAERVRAAARWLVESGAWRGPRASSGDTWLRDCAHGTGSDGTGNTGTWNTIAHTQHMSFVVAELRRAAGEG
ncbi:MAG TPA: hypothetical protein VK545_22945, partial [Streptomyces sp.]|nr:hypothetical protein [Streptomyces sp.]